MAVCKNCLYWVWDAQACKIHSAVERSKETGKAVKVDGIDGKSLVVSYDPETLEMVVDNSKRRNIQIWNADGDCPDYVEVITE